MHQISFPANNKIQRSLSSEDDNGESRPMSHFLLTLGKQADAHLSPWLLKTPLYVYVNKF